MPKRFKDDLAINIDEKKGHLYLGGADKQIRLFMIRPIDIIEFSEFAGQNASDILIWIGKTLGKEIMQKFFFDYFFLETTPVLKDIFISVLEGLTFMGFGYLDATFKKDHILVSNYNSLADAERDNYMAKNLCIINQGILHGVLDVLGFKAEGEEVECPLLGHDRCKFKFSLLEGEIPDELIDEEKSPEEIKEIMDSLVKLY
ncbi:MAG: hypothetical protein KGD57_01285 [Candidatus Lokiarchaeota archaeon]|nr:hypothetical protein [Candidatus Lokiarchaeota archaeon]